MEMNHVHRVCAGCMLSALALFGRFLDQSSDDVHVSLRRCIRAARSLVLHAQRETAHGNPCGEPAPISGSLSRSEAALVDARAGRPCIARSSRESWRMWLTAPKTTGPSVSFRIETSHRWFKPWDDRCGLSAARRSSTHAEPRISRACARREPCADSPLRTAKTSSLRGEAATIRRSMRVSDSLRARALRQSSRRFAASALDGENGGELFQHCDSQRLLGGAYEKSPSRLPAGAALFAAALGRCSLGSCSRFRLGASGGWPWRTSKQTFSKCFDSGNTTPMAI
jgi:hypothetical protein